MAEGERHHIERRTSGVWSLGVWSHLDDRVLVLQPGVRPVPQKWVSRVQDIGPPETSQLHVISKGESSPEIDTSMLRPSSAQ